MTEYDGMCALLCEHFGTVLQRYATGHTQNIRRGMCVTSRWIQIVDFNNLDTQDFYEWCEILKDDLSMIIWGDIEGGVTSDYPTEVVTDAERKFDYVISYLNGSLGVKHGEGTGLTGGSHSFDSNDIPF